MEIGKLYLVKHQGEAYGVRRTGDSTAAFYDIME